jgi:hypothetical protein
MDKKVFKVLSAIAIINTSKDTTLIQLISSISGLSIKQTIKTLEICKTDGLIESEESE